jgi:uncharacterized protein YdeI (YjbR/CyaY-like superfamily)
VIDGTSVHAETRAQWRAWLTDNAASSMGVWLVSWRTVTGRPQIGYEAAILEALCFGWVDSVQKPVDDERIALRFTPRTPGSPWAATNKARVERLRAGNLMTPAGEAVVGAAQADGSWVIFDSVDALEIPADLTIALEADPAAAANFAGFTDARKKAALRWLVLAKRAQTRATRVDQIVTAAAKNQHAAP